MSGGHGGNLRTLAALAGCQVDQLLDFSANINPLGPPEYLRATISRGLDELGNYPDPDSTDLVKAASEAIGCPEEKIVPGNGSSELLFALMRVIDQQRIVIPTPSYIDYAIAAQRAGKAVETIELRFDDGFAIDWNLLGGKLEGSEAVILGRPNNPTGVSFTGEQFRSFAADHPKTLFIIDEAFIDFVTGASSLAGDLPQNTVVLRSLTKFYAIPGLRLGLAIAQTELAEKIRLELPPWSVNSLAQVVGCAVLADTDYAKATLQCVDRERQILLGALSAIDGLDVIPGRANYLLVRLAKSLPDATELAGKLIKQRIAIRLCDNYAGLDGRYFRIAVRTAADNQRLVAAIKSALSIAPRTAPKKRTPAIMFQGTSSNAGKSVLAAAMCRILLQDGVRVAPFKSQNMSLNSFVTADGLEMGRAQVTQAQACRIAPDVRMNPILLKPNSDTGSQVIVGGKPVGNMRVGEYIRYKPEAFAAAKQCYDSLANDYDAIVLEGAGSPAEVNLKHHDIVNMNMAFCAEAPVLLVGDIDRGGVFASFVGTMEVLDRRERAQIAGFVINRFRGDASLLGPAIDYTQRFTGKGTFGIVPYVADLGLPEEDSVEFKSGSFNDTRSGEHAVDIAVIDLPHISNFTDLDALRIEPDIRLRVIGSPADLGTPDAVILPGSKNTLGDLAYLKSSGLAGRLMELAATGKCELLGICGGFQMLGKSILDPNRVESGTGRDVGLGLLDVSTSMSMEKTLSRTEAIHLETELSVSGYEIHHGLTSAGVAEPVFKSTSGEICGLAGAGGMVWGTYLHGLFDADEFRRWWIDRLRVRRGLDALGEVQCVYGIDHALDRLASVVRDSLDMKKIYEVMRL